MQTITFRMINSKVLKCNTGNYIQYLPLEDNGKEYIKKNVYVCMCVCVCVCVCV